MRLEKVVIQGFKSFADKTVFDFTKNFTAIVGPNGSGKSNISDAIRWVLSEQSVKTLRGKQSQDFIFSGSDKLAKSGMAQVELYLDNQDQSFPLDYKEVVIARKVFRNGESEYRVNNSKVRLQDIVMMLAQAKFGQKSYAVIGQGMITEFLNSTAQERKGFFDEATGVKEFQIKRDQAINKLIRTEDNLVQSETILTEIEPHLRSLTRQVKRLEKREKIEEQLSEAQFHYYGCLWSELKKEHFLLKQQFADRAAEIKNLEKVIDQEQQASELLATESSRGERYEQLQQKYNEVLEAKNNILKEQAILKGKLEVEHERQGELSLIWLQRKEDEIETNIHDLESSQINLKQELERKEHELGRKQKNYNSLKEEFRAEEYSILQLKQQIENESHALSVPEIQGRLQKIFVGQEDFLKRLIKTNSLDEFKEVQSEAKAVTNQLAELLDELDSTERGTLEVLQVDMKRKEQALEKLIKEKESLQHQINELKVSVESLKNKFEFNHNQLDRLQDEVSSIQSNIEESNSGKADGNQTAAYNQQLSIYEDEIEKKDKYLKGIRVEIDGFNKEEEDKKTKLVAIQSEMRVLQRKLTNFRQDTNTIEVNLARIETRQEDSREEIQREVKAELHDKIFNYQHTEKINRSELEKKIQSFHKQLEAIGSVDEETITEYKETKERYDFLKNQTTDLNKSISSLEKVINELDDTIHKQFQKNFKKINEGFQKYFKVLFEGGSAKLELITEVEKAREEQVEEGEIAGESLEEEKTRELLGKKKKKQKIIAGIDVIATPPGKKVTHINALSGGEKSLVAIALLCAIIAHNPSPFVVLDEVEAALDEENSEKLGAILKSLCQKTQIIVITHNRITMRAADILYGVTIGKTGKSHILSVELKEAEELVAEE